MKLLKTILTVVFLMQSGYILLAQEDDEWTQKKWEDVRDSVAVEVIKLMARIDTINMQIDSLNKVSEYIETLDCEEELYKLVGATKEQVNDFRSKFLITEQKINSNSGTPGEARSAYFSEISASKIICLPEFSDRFLSMRRKLDEWENKKVVMTASASLYEVVPGDCLKNIARDRYGDWKLWTQIWEANKDGVANADQIKEIYKKKITNPYRIYPGQILKIP